MDGLELGKDGVISRETRRSWEAAGSSEVGWDQVILKFKLMIKTWRQRYRAGVENEAGSQAYES